VYVAAFSPTGVGNHSYFSAYGPIPRFEPPPLVEPEVINQAASAVGVTSASVRAEINPHFYPSTSYFVEYGPQDCSAGPCTSTAVETLGQERNAFALTARVPLSGLASGTTYHYRFVAANGTLIVHGEDRTFTTRVAAAAKLPDNRHYEMVSPPAKNNGEVGNVVLDLAPHQATPDGEGLTFAGLAAFGENPESASGASQYVARRTGSGWMTDNISPPDQEGYIAPPVRGFSEDLGQAAMAVSQPPLTFGAPEGVENLYLRENSTGAITLLTESTPSFANGYCLNFSGASDDFSRVFFIASGALTSDASSAEGNNLYEWSQAEGLRLVSVLPNGKPSPPDAFNTFGASGIACVLGQSILHNAISADGSRAYWTRRVSGTTFQLFVRVNGNETIQLDKLQGGPGPAGNGKFWGASDDGALSFFSAPGKLVAGVGANALYRYDLNAAGGKPLEALTPGPGDANVLGVLGVSEDGRRVYFAARGALSPGAEAGKPNLYLWQEGEGLRYIATLADPDGSNWSGDTRFQTARVTPDGGALAFKSTAPLTGFDNTDQESGLPDAEAFLYDAAADTLGCASCDPSGARPNGGAKLPTWSTPFQQPRYLSNDGARLFFMSSDALDIHDTNSRQDLYQFERAGIGDCSSSLPTYSPAAGGCISLISTGTDPSAAIFIDASQSGNDVFFASPQSLFGADVDRNYDIYDARVGGGFPTPAPPAAPCSGESCRAPAVPPEPAQPGSSSYTGSGNVTTKKHKKRHHKRKHHHKKKAGKHSHKSGRVGR
jgi:hypothetical protein